MKLTELEPRFCRHRVVPNVPITIVDDAGERREVLRDQVYHDEVDFIAQAEGIMFLCPKCFAVNGGPRGTHMVLCWSPKVGPEAVPGPGRWELLGTGFDDLSLRAGSSSVLLNGGCAAHFFVENGEIRMC